MRIATCLSCPDYADLSIVGGTPCSVTWTSLWSSAMGMVGRLDREIRSGWRLALAGVVCMDEGLLGNAFSIGGCQGWGAGEDQDAKAEKVSNDPRGNDSGKLRSEKLDGEHI